MTYQPATIDPFLTAFVERHRSGKPAAVVARIDLLFVTHTNPNQSKCESENAT